MGAGCVAVAAMVLSLTACPRIHHYEARPLVVCPTQPVRIAWDVSGWATLSAMPPVPGLGSVAQQGTKSIVLQESTRITLHVANVFGRPAVNHQDVRVVQFDADETVGESTSCGQDELVAEAVRPVSELDQHLRVLEVELGPGLDRELIVEHHGKSVTLGPDARTSSELRGITPAGRWLLRAPLRPGEVCGQRNEIPLPEALFIKVRMECTVESP